MAFAVAKTVQTTHQATCCSCRTPTPRVRSLARVPSANRLSLQQAGPWLQHARCIAASAGNKQEYDAPPTPAARDEEAYYEQMKKEMEGSSIWESEAVSTGLKVLLVGVVIGVGAIIAHLGQPVIDNTINSFPHIE